MLLLAAAEMRENTRCYVCAAVQRCYAFSAAAFVSCPPRRFDASRCPPTLRPTMREEIRCSDRGNIYYIQVTARERQRRDGIDGFTS